MFCVMANFYPTELKGCPGIVFSHGIWMGGWASGGAVGRAVGEKFLRAVSQKNVRCRKLILGRDIG